MPDVRSVLREGIARLEDANVPSAVLAAEILLMHVLDRDRTFLYTHPEYPIHPTVSERFCLLIARRSAGEPVQYLTGKQEFWGLQFEVTPAVLIPRPETEHLIEVALDRLGSAQREAALRIADVGTGSGCIAVALAAELPNARIVATDVSMEALAVARRNAARHRVDDRIEFQQMDLLSGVRVNNGDARFDLIVSNPPYVALDEASTLQREVRDHEPHIALFGGTTGVEIYARLIEEAGELVQPGGALVMELGYDLANRVEEMIKSAGCWTKVVVTNDLAGIPRVLAATRT